jgi:AAHS family 4-hydroxybenzoate transporter-like MFS transporter
MAVNDDAFDVPEFINRKRVGAAQYLTVLLCGLVMFLDGFDTQSISYMAPAIAKGIRAVAGHARSDLLVALAGLMIG